MPRITWHPSAAPAARDGFTGGIHLFTIHHGPSGYRITSTIGPLNSAPEVHHNYPQREVAADAAEELLELFLRRIGAAFTDAG